MFAMRIDEWTDELVARALESKAHYDILREERLIKQKLSRDEFPLLGQDAAPRGPRNKSSRQRFKKKRK